MFLSPAKSPLPVHPVWLLLDHKAGQSLQLVCIGFPLSLLPENIQALRDPHNLDIHCELRAETQGTETQGKQPHGLWAGCYPTE